MGVVVLSNLKLKLKLKLGSEKCLIKYSYYEDLNVVNLCKNICYCMQMYA